MKYEDHQEQQAVKYAHSALLDFQQFLKVWSANRLDELRLITDINLEIQELTDTILDLEKVFPYLDIDNQNLN